ncbi:Na(+)-translocating NADH-quinone reductase subunit A [Algoriphagus halophytocola]|uniref:Na(+)-translocating NADH-quinone reductase subunit A n=1 Tax=Algoriphagus halophytocola TaxID=2991499 RepID=A0ABY6MFH3_9BACT|nr:MULTISPECIES: Na(+)-translocating NADH-quinone reductase subunit A [unclassified Algoriphagus]UZD20934.1 Na(+)-translocating NADH-quinone reductase subunit A [Algoriphagus sp. TR-M5]WBL42100.1 Na(+)-translocating NADH-quinone reductase subunit A [Algoriphagus sp. TR-M9]
MSKIVKLKKGFDINLAGKAKQELADFASAQTFAIKPTDFIGLQRPKVLVKEGDTVKAGTPILIDKAMDQVIYVAPVSGEIVEVKRGDRRKLLEIRILADSTITHEQSEKLDLASLDREALVAKLAASGVWPNIIQRPYGIVANPEDTPKSIFVSAFDTHPLAPDYAFTLKGQEQYLQAGFDVLAKLTSGKVHLNVDGAKAVPSIFSAIKGVQLNKFEGPHPAGNVGVQIHHLDPINKGEIAWTVNPQGVAQIGKFALEGVYDAAKVIAVTGSELTKPAYVKTYLGACVSSFVKGNLNSGHVRVISGNVLTGEKIALEGFLGYYHNQITVIPEGDYYEFMGWAKPSTRLSFHRALGLLSFLSPKKEHVLDSNARGEERAFVQTGVFESVTPMDILPVYLLKAIMANDFDEMEELGIYEIIEEDLALCEFVDVSKHPVQELVRKGIELIQYS